MRGFSSGRSAVALIGLALLVRGAAVAVGRESLQADPDGYRRLAENLVSRATLGRANQPTAFRPPLYPMLLAGCVALGPWADTAIGLLHVAMGMATVWMVFWMACR